MTPDAFKGRRVSVEGGIEGGEEEIPRGRRGLEV